MPGGIIVTSTDTTINTTITITNVEYVSSVTNTVMKATITIQYPSKRVFLDHRSIESIVLDLARSRKWLVEELAEAIAKYIAELVNTHASRNKNIIYTVRVRIETQETSSMHVTIETEYP